MGLAARAPGIGQVSSMIRYEVVAYTRANGVETHLVSAASGYLAAIKFKQSNRKARVLDVRLEQTDAH